MDWIHCNSCFTQPGDVHLMRFFITNCGHIYCNDCLEQNKSSECGICHIRYSTIPLRSNMCSEVEMYFHDPVANIKKQVKVLEFQQTHRGRLISRYRERVKYYKAVKKDNFKLRERLKLCKGENDALINENKNLKANLHELNKKYESSLNGRQPRAASRSLFNPLCHSSPKKTTQSKQNSSNFYLSDDLDEISFNPNPKRIPDSNFLQMRKPSSSAKLGKDYTTPEPRRFQGNYRSNRVFTAESDSPPTPESVIRECSDIDPSLRKNKYSENENFQSPTPATKLHGLRLTKL